MFSKFYKDLENYENDINSLVLLHSYLNKIILVVQP